MSDRSTSDTDQKVTAEWLEGRFFCYPIECKSCGKEIAGAEENGAVGRDDVLPIDAEGGALCRDHPEKTHFVAAGAYAHGGGTPCDTGRSFRPKDVVNVRLRETGTDGGQRDE